MANPVVTLIKKIIGKADVVLNPILKKVLGDQAAAALSSAVLSVVSTDVGKIVKDVVEEIEALRFTVGPDGKPQFVTGAEAREAALAKLKADSKIIAADVSTTLLNTLIELAVLSLNKAAVAVAVS